jgi:uncharacterized protein (TIGR02300 family)
VTKAELGTKRVCPNCGTKYYDLNRHPIACPKCGTVFEVVAATRTRAVANKPPVAPVVEEEPIAAEAAELVTLEDADEEAAADGQVKTEGEEVDDEADDTFLQEEEEDGEDVGDIIGDVEEEER